MKTEVNLGNQKSFPSHPSSIYGQAILQSKSGLGGAGNTIICFVCKESLWVKEPQITMWVKESQIANRAVPQR